MVMNIKKGCKIEQETINKYKSILPGELLKLWEEFGLANIYGGYMRMINPDEYQELVKEAYFRGDISIPIFVTAFGDIITIEEGEYVGLIRFKNGIFNIVAKNFKRFWQNIDDEYFQDKYLELKQYERALDKLGAVEDDECYGYVPLLGLGGMEKIENIKKVKIKEYIGLIVQLVGRIE